MEWEADPGLAKIRDEFIDSFAGRLTKLRDLTVKLTSGVMKKEDAFAVQVLVHNLAGSAESYGFPVITKIAGAIDDLITLRAEGLTPDMDKFLKLLDEALAVAFQNRKDPILFLDDTRTNALISVAEALHD